MQIHLPILLMGKEIQIFPIKLWNKLINKKNALSPTEN